MTAKIDIFSHNYSNTEQRQPVPTVPLKAWLTENHVWPLTQILFPFGKKSSICLEGKSMTPHWENTMLFPSSQQLHCLHLGPLKGFLSRHGTLQGPSTRLVRCFWNYRDIRTPSQVCNARCGGPRTPSKPADANLDFAFF